MTNKSDEKSEHVIKDQHNDLHADSPNPVNRHPEYPGDYPPPKFTTTKIPDLPPPTEAATESPAINRPPKPPGSSLGPYFQFITTDLNKMLWIGSALIFRDISFNQPKIEFTCDVRVDYQWEILYENLFHLRAYRVHLFIELLEGEGDEKIYWNIDWGDKQTNGSFLIARADQKWRGGFFSCNGFDAYVPEEVASNLTYANVWNHLLSIHEQTPFHLLLWGGDQNYIDFIFEDIPFLRAWVNMQWNEKWTTDFRDDLKEQVEQYHFNTYAENWNRRPEVKQALESIPSLMMWDDHDIFDGAGSYPPLLHDSPMMMGLFLSAQKMRLLFQHHTTLEKAREHYLFGHQGFNFFARCGRNLAILGADGRTERNTAIVQHEKTWNMIFNRLDQELDDVKHLIVLFPVPFSFVRVHIAETIFERLKNLPNKWRELPPVKSTNSIFGLPELYDDLIDEWTHDAHIEERDRILRRFQQLAQDKHIRISYFSGDVHCCGVSRFQSKTSHHLSPINDPKLMYQIISSAIVNMPPSKNAIRVAHRFKTKWEPFDDTEEEIIDFFERKPENGRKAFHKKFRPNRNWCYFEQCSHIASALVPVVDGHCLSCRSSKSNSIIPSIIDREQPQTHELKVRFWLESSNKHEGERKFVNYDLLIPHLK